VAIPNGLRERGRRRGTKARHDAADFGENLETSGVEIFGISFVLKYV
jgi:hypothetical protein